MFMGEFSHAIDTKGRLIIPAKMREELGDSCIVTRGMDNCLTLYTAGGWERICRNLNRKSDTQSAIRALKRFLIGGASEIEFDKQGRVLIPASLRKYASLHKDAIILGVGDHIEIWSGDNWDKYADEVDDRIEEIAEGLFESLEDITL